MARIVLFIMINLLVGLGFADDSSADLAQIRESGVLRHLGVPYSNFVSGDGDGLDVDILKMYASELGVKYEHVPTSWETVIADLSGKRFLLKGDMVEIIGEVPIKGDIIGNGFTILPWRREVINFSIPYFPSAVWVLAAAGSSLKPINPGNDPAGDVALTKELLIGKHILGIKDTCLDPVFYDLKGATAQYREGLQLNDLPGAIMKGDYEITMQDAPDALLVLANNPGKIKVLGPITEHQFMAFGISKDSPELLKSFDQFLTKLKDSGKLREMIVKYYPRILDYFPNAGN